MRLLPIVKGTLQKFKSRISEEPSTPNEQADGFHTTPAGEFPRNGPKSSIVACIMFYLSKIITIIGLILVARAVWFEEVINLLSYSLEPLQIANAKSCVFRPIYFSLFSRIQAVLP